MRVFRIAAAPTLVAAVAAVAATAATTPPVADPPRPRMIASLQLPKDRRFELRYTHSIYKAATREVFEARRHRGFRLITIASTHEGVLDYYGLAGRTTLSRGWYTQRLADPPRMAAIPLIATRFGRRTLVVAGRRVPLYPADRETARVLIRLTDRQRRVTATERPQ